MAESGTLSGVVFDDPASADNSPFATHGTGPGEGNDPNALVDGKGQSAGSPLETRLADIERTNQRHREQLAGGAAEAQRLVEQNKLLAQQNADLLTTFRDLLKTPAATPPTAPSSDPTGINPQLLGFSKALKKAVIEGDYDEADRIDAALPALLATLSGSQRPSPETLRPEQSLRGPAIIESPFTTVVIDPGARVVRKRSGSLVITP